MNHPASKPVKTGNQEHGTAPGPLTFSESTDTTTAQLRVLSLQNQKLKAAREIRLPLLMSREVTV